MMLIDFIIISVTITSIKYNNLMKTLLVVTFLMFSFIGSAYAYPESQMEDCISSALDNPATKSISKSSIRNYCDCALKAIIDENKNIRDSGYQCAQENFN